jgi:hypothetical protein
MTALRQLPPRLHVKRIGDLFLLAARDTVFGSLTEARQDVRLRSHGSRYEQPVPVLLLGIDSPLNHPNSISM